MQPLITTKIADTQYDIHDYLSARWSPRSFADQALTSDTIHRLFEAARWAASSYNEQPWRFAYGQQGTAAYDKIFKCLGEFNQGWAKNAPVLVLTVIKEQFGNGKDNYHALHDLGLATANMTFQAQSEGIALHHMAGVDFEKAKEVFEVPEGYHVVSAIAVGYYGGEIGDIPKDLQGKETQPRERKAMEEIVGEGNFPIKK